jgi:hypothetical protein
MAQIITVSRVTKHADIDAELNRLGLTGDARKRMYTKLYAQKMGKRKPAWKGIVAPKSSNTRQKEVQQTLAEASRAGKGRPKAERVQIIQQTFAAKYGPPKPKKKLTPAQKAANSAARRAKHAALVAGSVGKTVKLSKVKKSS